MKKFFKKIAAKILKNEIYALRLDVERFQRLAFGHHPVILSRGIIKAIMELLPNPNEFANGGISTTQLVANREMKYDYTFRGQKRQASVLIVRDERAEKQKADEQGIMIAVPDFGIRVFIPLEKVKMNTNVMGANTEVESFVWDIFRAGIRMVSDKDFIMILEFIAAEKNVLEEI